MYNNLFFKDEFFGHEKYLQLWWHFKIILNKRFTANKIRFSQNKYIFGYNNFPERVSISAGTNIIVDVFFSKSVLSQSATK